MFRSPLSRNMMGLSTTLIAMLALACNEPFATSASNDISLIGSSLHAPSALKIGDPCSTGEKRDADMDIDANGGTITVCGWTLEVPASAVAKRVHFHMHAEAPGKDHPAYVKFTPEGLKFPAGAQPTLTLSTDLVPAGATPFIVYLDDHGKVKEVLSTFGLTANTISARLEHFSGYAVDW